MKAKALDSLEKTYEMIVIPEIQRMKLSSSRAVDVSLKFSLAVIFFAAMSIFALYSFAYSLHLTNSGLASLGFFLLAIVAFRIFVWLVFEILWRLERAFRNREK